MAQLTPTLPERGDAPLHRCGHQPLFGQAHARSCHERRRVLLCHLGQGVIAVITDGGDASLYLAVTDNVDSYVHLVNAATGTAAFSVMYDPWGRMTRTAGRMPFHRGYGGHEMLTEFGLINMNGRMYDFNTARFLSPDEYVQLPHDSQSFNRYSYCLNNPLKYTDPSGELFGIDDILIGAAIGGIINFALSSNHSWKDFVVGAASGAVGAGVGGYLSNSLTAVGVWSGAKAGAITGTVSGAASGLISQSVSNCLSGRNIFSGLLSATIIGGISGALTGAISGGIEGYKYAKDNGVDPWTRNFILSEREYEWYQKTMATQPDPTKECFAYASENAVADWGGESAGQFIETAKKVTSGYDGGADVRQVLTKCGYCVERYTGPAWSSSKNTLAKLSNYNRLNMLGTGMDQGHYRAIISIDNEGVKHFVNVESFSISIRSMPFRIAKQTVSLSRTRVFDVATGSYRHLSSSSIYTMDWISR